MAADTTNLSYVEKYRRQRKKMRALLEIIDDQKNEFFRKEKEKQNSVPC
ncbi:hypothetical protein RM549_06255 [Salegentibacter sp. F188]|uniref:Uncharacterized protein n=1 Tax=Autumnicola patrickiae TaxID=3075591 RepID=A0ABU3E0D1_9FLAO|nr:hypothetical protein [Salegentibacter sp. F188]MDT0689380.1 hypothetical protein [Salegentibacter sp. F188]